MIKKVSLLCLLISSPVFAVVPHSFKAGSPAKASEVNENFSALENEIVKNTSSVEAELQDLNNNVSEIERKLDSVSADTGWNTNIHSVNYDEASANIGDLVRINGEEYRIISAPFVEFGSDSLYSLTFPVNEKAMTVSLTYHHSDSKIGNHDFTISGYPARNKFISDSRSVFMSRNGSTDSSLSQGYSYHTQIKVNETILTVQFLLSENIESVRLPEGTYDFTSALDTSGYYHDHKKIEAINEMIDYIKITRVE